MASTSLAVTKATCPKYVIMAQLSCFHTKPSRYYGRAWEAWTRT